MSVKFEKDTFQTTTQNVMNKAADGKIPGTSGKHPISERVGTALTGGMANAGTKGYLAVRILFSFLSGAIVVAWMMRSGTSYP